LAGVEKAGRATGRIVETAQGSYEVLVGHVLALQDRNVRFAQSIMETFGKEYREQARASQLVIQELVELFEEQRAALRTISEESFDAYAHLLYAPLSYHGKDFAAFRKASR
jgi:hypothetical protein